MRVFAAPSQLDLAWLVLYSH